MLASCLPPEWSLFRLATTQVMDDIIEEFSQRESMSSQRDSCAASSHSESPGRRASNQMRAQVSPAHIGAASASAGGASGKGRWMSSEDLGVAMPELVPNVPLGGYKPSTGLLAGQKACLSGVETAAI